jgi:hypothetical protein
MSFRTFKDRSGNAWVLRPRSRWEWHFEPQPGNTEPTRIARAPGYQDDPYELSQEELQRLFDAALPRRTTPRKSPFKD